MTQFCLWGHGTAAFPSAEQNCSSLGAAFPLGEGSSSLSRVRSYRLPVPGLASGTSSDSLSRLWFVFFRLCSSDIKYTARWSNETVFSSILISPKMVTDHMPDVVLKALNSLSRDHGSCLPCRTQECNTNAV